MTQQRTGWAANATSNIPMIATPNTPTNTTTSTKKNYGGQATATKKKTLPVAPVKQPERKLEVDHPDQQIVKIGVTGPSSFTNEVIVMVEEFFGCNPVLLYQNRDENLFQTLKLVDAVILAGGKDIHPMTYNQSCLAKKNMKDFDFRRDMRETKIVNYCIENHVPIMGICRGHQLLGSLRVGAQIIPDLCETSKIIHQPNIQEPKMPLDPTVPIHFVTLLNQRNVYGEQIVMPLNKKGKTPLLSKEMYWVNSFHHQGLLFEAEKHAMDQRIQGIAFTDSDKAVIELMHCPEERWMSCQWHPEYDWRYQSSSYKFLRYFRDLYLNSNNEELHITSDLEDQNLTSYVI